MFHQSLQAEPLHASERRHKERKGCVCNHQTPSVDCSIAAPKTSQKPQHDTQQKKEGRLFCSRQLPPVDLFSAAPKTSQKPQHDIEQEKK
jgi:hypothetical protein